MWAVGRHLTDDHVRIFSPDGVALPFVDCPLVGTDEERALAEYNRLTGEH